MELAHRATVAAPADLVYDLIADITQGPRFFDTVVHADYEERGDDTDRVARWVRQGDTIRLLRARRELDRTAGRITFHHEDPAPPVTALTGEWSFTPTADDVTEVRLRHTVTGGDASFVDKGAAAQIARLKEVAENVDELTALEVFYEAELLIDGELDDVFDYFYQADRWPERIPHCLSVDKREDSPHLQIVEMQVKVPSGAVHTTRQARVCLPGDKIVWRQIGGLPPLDQALYGYTSFTRTADGVLAKAGQTELLKPAAVAKRGWDVQEATDHVAEVRGGRNLGALRSAQEYLNRLRESAGQR